MGRWQVILNVENQPSLGKTFLDLPAISAYGIWLMMVLFPLILAGILSPIDKRRSTDSLLLSSIALGVVAASYMLRFYLVRNTHSLRSRVVEATNREQAIYIIIGGFWWWLVTLTCAIAAAISSRSLF